jgi:hypothetical protein
MSENKTSPVLPWRVWPVFNSEGYLETICSTKVVAQWFIDCRWEKEHLYTTDQPWLVIRPEMIEGVDD